MDLFDDLIENLQDALVIRIKAQGLGQHFARFGFVAHTIKHSAQVIVGVFVIWFLSNGYFVFSNGFIIVAAGSHSIAQHNVIDRLTLIDGYCFLSLIKSILHLALIKVANAQIAMGLTKLIVQ